MISAGYTINLISDIPSALELSQSFFSPVKTQLTHVQCRRADVCVRACVCVCVVDAVSAYAKQRNSQRIS